VTAAVKRKPRWDMALVALLALAAVAQGGALYAGPSAGEEYPAPPWSAYRPLDTARTVDVKGTDDYADGREAPRTVYADNLPPLMEEEIPLYRALAVDFFVPGGGALYHGNYYRGAAFGALKLAGAWAVYHYYRVWRYRRSLYHSARDANAALDPHHELSFRVPGEGYKTVGELRRDYDSAAQSITFAVIANVLVYGASLYTTYHLVERMNERSIPAFELTVDRNDSGELTGYSLRCIFTYRI